MFYKEYYEIHKNDEFDENWISNNELISALIESVISLDETFVIDSLENLRTYIRENGNEENKYIIEFLNIIKYMFTSLKENEDINLIVEFLDKLNKNGYWFFYKEPFKDCIDKLNVNLNQEKDNIE